MADFAHGPYVIDTRAMVEFKFPRAFDLERVSALRRPDSWSDHQAISVCRRMGTRASGGGSRPVAVFLQWLLRGFQVSYMKLQNLH